jgi:small subunit ribosomal protein S15
MARIHAHTRGKSHSTRPASPSPPTWLTMTPSEVSSLVMSLSKEGLSPSEIGLNLRDHHAIPLVKPITGKTITQLLSDGDVKKELPEDLGNLVEKAIGLQKHIKNHNTDHRNVRSLELIEAKIHRLSKYYKRSGRLSKNWKYSAMIAQLE